MVLSLVTGALTVRGHGRLSLGSAWTRLPSVTACGVGLLACLLLRDALAGWRRWRAGLRDRSLTPGEWVLALSRMGLLAFLLSLGPIVWVGSRRAGSGLYLWLHPYVLPLRAIRGTTRFGLLVLMVVALLAGLGMAWLLSRLPRTPRWLVTAVVIGALALDYVAPSPDYQRIETYTRPVDAVLRADPDDVAVLEVAAQRAGRRRRRQAPVGRARPAGGQRLRRLRPGPPARAVRRAGRVRAAVRVRAGPDGTGANLPLRYLVVRDAAGRARPPLGGTPSPTSRAGSSASGAPRRRRSLRGGVAAGAGDGTGAGRVLRPASLAALARAALRPVRTQAGVEQWVSLTLNGDTSRGPRSTRRRPCRRP